MLHWHLLRSNSLWGPVNQVSPLTRWNSRDANLAKLPFMGPALILQAPLSTPKSKDTSLEHIQPGLSSQWKYKAHRVQTRKPDCGWSDPETANSTPESKPYSASPWHGTEPSEQICDLKIESLWVQSVTRGRCDTLWTRTCSTLSQELNTVGPVPGGDHVNEPTGPQPPPAIYHCSAMLAQGWQADFLHTVSSASGSQMPCTSFLKCFLPLSIAPRCGVAGPTSVHASQRLVFYNPTTVQTSNWKRS